MVRQPPEVADNETKFIFVLESVGNDRLSPRRWKNQHRHYKEVKLLKGSQSQPPKTYISFWEDWFEKTTTLREEIRCSSHSQATEMYASRRERTVESVGFIFKRVRVRPRRRILRVTDSLILFIATSDKQRTDEEQAMNKKRAKSLGMVLNR